MSAAAAVFEFIPERGKGRGESFSSIRQRERVRLSPDEIHDIRYVLCEWSSEVGYGSSSSAAQLERIAASPHLIGVDAMTDDGAAAALERAIAMECEEAWKRAWLLDRIDLQRMAVRGGMSSHYRGGPLSPVERWCDRSLEPVGCRVRRTEFGERVHRCWLALRLLAGSGTLAVPVLYALYGDRPPGLLEGLLWDRTVNADYVRVVRFVPEAGRSTTDLEARLAIDKHRGHEETDEAFRSRLAAAQAERWALLNRLGDGCERVIELASNEYRAAWGASA